LIELVVGWVLVWGLPDGSAIYFDGPYETQQKCFDAGLAVPEHYKVFRCKHVKEK